MDCDTFVLGIKTKYGRKWGKVNNEILDFLESKDDHLIHCIKNQDALGIFKLGTRKIVWIVEFFELRAKAYILKQKTTLG